MKGKPVVELTAKQIREEFGIRAFKRASLKKCEAGYTLSLITPTEEVPVLLKGAGELKTWASPDSAIRYIRNNFHGIHTIDVQLGATK